MVVRVLSIVLDGFDERCVGRFARAERVAIRHGSVIFTVTEPCAESEGFFFGVENYRLGEVEHIIRVKVFFETVNIIVKEEIDSEGVGYNVNFYCHKKKILKLSL